MTPLQAGVWLVSWTAISGLMMLVVTKLAILAGGLL